MKRIVAFLLVVSIFLLTVSCSVPMEKIGGAVSNVKQKVQSVFSKTKEETISIFGTAKDKACYVYDEAASWAQSVSLKVKDKAMELIGDGKEFIQGLTELNEIQIADEDTDYNPYATAKSELFVPYYMSSVLSDLGYFVYNGGVYYKDHVYVGLIFTKNEVFIEEEGDTICSCGFIQLVSDSYSGTRVSEDMVNTGLIAISANTDEAAKAFIVQEHIELDPFSGIIDDTYFNYQQTSDYVVEISFKPNAPEYYNRSIALFNFDTNESVFDAHDTQNELEKLYAESPVAFQAGADASNALADYIESEDTQISSLCVLNSNVVDTICSKTVSGYNSCVKYIKSLLGKTKIGDSPLITIDEDGKTHLMDSEYAMDSDRVTKGLVCAVGSGLIAGTVARSVATVAIGVTAGGLPVVTAIIITTGACSVVYNVSNMLEGIQNVYYGAKGNDSEANNPVLMLFKELIPDENVATLVYHIWGISNSVVCSLMSPIARALKIAKTCGMRAFQTTGRVARAALTSIAKMVATGVASGLVYKYVEKVVEKVTGSHAFGRVVGFASATATAYLTFNGLQKFDEKLNLSGLNSAYDANNPEIKYTFDEWGNVKNTTIKSKNATYTLDEFKRPINVKAKVEPREGDRLPIKDSIQTIGKGSELSGDDRGHLLGDQLGGSNESYNMVPQNASINRGAYRDHENQLIELAKLGNTVDVEIVPHYQGSSNRPYEIEYSFRINNGELTTRVFVNPS